MSMSNEYPFGYACLDIDIIPKKGGHCSFYNQLPKNKGLGIKNRVVI